MATAARTVDGATAVPEAPRPPFPLWPIPREARVADERLLLTDAVIVVPPGDRRAQWPGRLLAEIVADEFGVALPIVAGAAPEGRTPIVVGEASAAAVSSAVDSRGSHGARGGRGLPDRGGSAGAVVAGRDYRGALYGVSSFVQLVHRWGHQSVAVRRAVVRDWPFLPVRWVHLYLPGRDQLDFARRYMRDVLLRYKYNGIVLEVGGGMRLESHPEISVGWKRTVAEWYAHGETIDKLGEGIPLGTAQRFAASLHVGVGGGGFVEKDDVRHLAEWAELYGLEIVPEVQALTHTYYIASARRDVAEDPEMAWPDSYCPSNPESYRLYFDVLDEYIDVLKPKRVHIGHDEWRAGAFCSRCRGKDPGALYADDVLKIHRHLKEKGIETWMWGDHFVDGHNRFAKSWSEGGVVRYERPDTASARDRVAAGDERDPRPQLVRRGGRRALPEAGLALRGRQLLRQRGEGLAGPRGAATAPWEVRCPRGAPSRSSCWASCRCRRRSTAATSCGRSTTRREEEALEHVGHLLPAVRGRVSATPPPSVRADPMRFEVLDLASAFNHAPTGEGWDLSGLKPGRRYVSAFRTRSPTRRLGRALGRRRRPTARRRADAGRASRPRPLGVARLRPVGHGRRPPVRPRRRPDPLPARVVGAARLLRDPLRGRPGAGPRDPLRRDGRSVGPGPRAALLLRPPAGGRHLPDGRAGGGLGERVAEPAPRRAHRFRHPRGLAGAVERAADPARRHRGREAARRGPAVSAPSSFRRSRCSTGRSPCCRWWRRSGSACA